MDRWGRAYALLAVPGRFRLANHPHHQHVIFLLRFSGCNCTGYFFKKPIVVKTVVIDLF